MRALPVPRLTAGLWSRVKWNLKVKRGIKRPKLLGVPFCSCIGALSSPDSGMPFLLSPLLAGVTVSLPPKTPVSHPFLSLVFQASMNPAGFCYPSSACLSFESSSLLLSMKEHYTDIHSQQ